MRVPDRFRALRPFGISDPLDYAWLTASSSERDAIDIVAELFKRRVQLNREPLLNPPGGSEASGSIVLGQILHGVYRLQQLGVHPVELTHHIGLFGRSGGGKSTLALHILRQLSDLGMPWLCLDYKRAARVLFALDPSIRIAALGRNIGSAFAFNPLRPAPSVPLDTHLRQLSDQLCHIWFGGEGVRAMMLSAMLRVTADDQHATLLDVRAYVESLAVTQREILWRQTCRRILEMLTTGQLGRVLNSRSDNIVLHEMMAHRTIIELDGCGLNDGIFLSSFLIRFMTQFLMAGTTRETLQFFCLVEEAHHLLGKHDHARESDLETAIREAREIGLGFCVVDQSISSLSGPVLQNLATTVVFNCKHRTDINAAASALLLDEDQKTILGTLPVGQCVVRLSERWPRAVHVKVPQWTLPKGSISDADVENSANASRPSPDPPSQQGDSTRSTSSNSIPTVAAEINPLKLIPINDKRRSNSDSNTNPMMEDTTTQNLLDHDQDAAAYVADVAFRPLRSAVDRYQAIKLSRRKGDATKRALVDAGILNEISIITSTGRILLTALTSLAIQWLKRHRIDITPVNGSLLHGWWQAEVARRLSDAGWQVTTEYRILGHAFDIHATRDTNEILLEIETAKSDWLGNAAALSESPVSHKAMLWLEPQSAMRARLAIPAGIRLLLPSELQAWIAQLGADRRHQRN